MSLRGLLSGLRDAIFTPTCGACGTLFTTPMTAGLMLCPDCARTVERATHPSCPVCGEPTGLLGPAETTCQLCKSDPPGFDVARASFVYGGAIVALLLGLKHGRRFEHARPLGRIIAATAAIEGLAGADVIVPVPTTTKRFLKRGYNQAALLARSAAALLGIPVLGRSLTRVREPGPQGHRSRAERIRSVRGNFDVRATGAIEGRRVLLVDDVITTGATASECAKALRKAGAVKVSVVACARAVSI